MKLKVGGGLRLNMANWAANIARWVACGPAVVCSELLCLYNYWDQLPACRDSIKVASGRDCGFAAPSNLPICFVCALDV